MPEPTPVLTPFAVPSDRLWFDPAVVGRNLYVRPTDVVVPFSGVELVAPANPYRWAVGFTLAPTSGVGCSVSPWTDADAGGLYQLAHNRLDWLNTFTFGPLVAGPWYATGGAGSIVRVLEVIRIAKG